MSDAPAGGQPASTAAPFVAGFASRHATAAHLLQQAFEAPPAFAPADLRDRARRDGDVAARPRHFSPADRAHNPTAGWDPFDAGAEAGASAGAGPDAIAAARAAGFAEGQAVARAATAEAHDRDRALLDDLAGALALGGRLDRERVATRIREIVLLLVGKLVGETGVSPDLLAERVAAATDMLADSAESALLRVHPADVSLLEGRLPTSVFAIGDAAVARGSFVLESASTVVEDGPALWLEQLTAAIDRAPLPAARAAADQTGIPC